MTGVLRRHLERRFLISSQKSDLVSFHHGWRGFLFLQIRLVNFFMELLIAVPVIAGACLLGSFLGKAFVAIIQKFSND